MKAKTLPESEMFERETEGSPSQFYVDAIKSRPSASNTATVLVELTNRLEGLAKKAGLSTHDFLALAESSRDFNEDYIEAITTARQIARLKQQP